MVEKNYVVLLVAVGILVVVSLFSNTLTGNTPAEQRNVDICTPIDGLGAKTVTSGRTDYKLNRCISTSFNYGRESSRIARYSCSGNKVSYTTSICPEGTICRTSNQYPQYGPAAYCG